MGDMSSIKACIDRMLRLSRNKKPVTSKPVTRASEYVEVRRKLNELPRPELIIGSTVAAFIDADGAAWLAPNWWTREEALALAAWINETFGEVKGEL